MNTPDPDQAVPTQAVPSQNGGPDHNSTSEGQQGDPNCLFCKIVTGEIPSRIVYQDQDALAFLDIGPFHRGHSLVIPKRHVADLLTVPASLPEIAPAIDATARLLVDRLDADGLNLLSSVGEVAGQEVFHFHVHLIPRYASTPGLWSLIGPKPAAEESELDAVLAQVTGGQATGSA